MACSFIRRMRLLRIFVFFALTGGSTLVQACGYTGGVGMESFFSVDGLIDIGIFVLLLGAALAAFPDVLQRFRQGGVTD